MDKFDIIYNSSTPEVFFTELVKQNQRVIQHIFSTHFFHKVRYDNERLDDLKQEGILYAWINLPKTPEQYRKFRSFGISWITWFCNNLRWGASHYLLELHSKTKVQPHTVDFSQEYGLQDDPSEGGRFSSADYEKSLNDVNVAIKALPLKEQEMINIWIREGGISQAAGVLGIKRFAGQVLYQKIFAILRQDLKLLGGGHSIFTPVHMSFRDALRKGFNEVKPYAHKLQIYDTHNQYLALKNCILDNGLADLDIQKVDEDVCDIINKKSFLVNDSACKISTRRRLLVYIMNALVELKIIRFNPAAISKYGISSDIKVLENNTGRDFDLVFLPEKEFLVLKGLANEYRNKQATADNIGIPIMTLRRLLKSQSCTAKTADRVIRYLNSLHLTTLVSSDGFEDRKRIQANKTIVAIA